MSLNLEATSAHDRTVEQGDSSDQSLSDSWTVLDSSHLKEDGDLSDAESVEVLHEELAIHDEISEGKVDEEIPFHLSDTTDSREAVLTASATTVEDIEPVSPPEVIGSDAADKVDGLAPAAAAAAAAATASNPPRKQRQRKKYLFNGVPIEVVGEPISTGLLKVSIYFLIVDLILLCYFAMSSLAGLVEIHSPNYLKPSKGNQPFEMDPLSLQLSYVLAEWKKNPHEDHSLDQHVLKTLLLHYGGSSELSANLHALTEKVQKHNGLIKRLGKVHEKESQHRNMVASAHIAHSVACILGRKDNHRAIPAELFTNRTDRQDELAPEPGFWFNDWYLPQYFKANDTYYRLSSKPMLPPMHSLYLPLDSAQWNEYFWKFSKDNDEGEDDDKIEFPSIKGYGSELDGEETERSPLDLQTSVEITDEESLGNVEDHSEELAEDQVHLMYKKDMEHRKPTDESVAHRFELFNDDDLSGYSSRYSGLKGSVAKGGEYSPKGRLTQLYEELALEEQQREQLDRLLRNSKTVSSFVDEFPPHKSQGKVTFDESFKESSSKDNDPLSEPLSEKLSEEWCKKDGINEPSCSDAEVLVKDREERVKRIFDTLLTDDFDLKLDEFLGLQEVKKVKTRENIQKSKYDAENVKVKNKRRKKVKGKPALGNNEPGSKKKLRKRNNKKSIKGNEEIHSEIYFKYEDPRQHHGQNNHKNRFVEERFGDWNTRMAEGREKLRALNDKDDEIWVFERARARRDMREEVRSE